MASKSQKKNIIRQDIVDSAKVYAQHLANKTFLYVFDNEFFEVTFPIHSFRHLTGVESNLPVQEFYKNAKRNRLTTKQFYFTQRHPYSNAKKKLPCLKQLPILTTNMVCVLKNIETRTIVCTLGITNLEFTLGLIENKDRNGNKRNNYFVPMTLRTETTSVERSQEGSIVDFIFSKDTRHDKYDTILVKDENKEIPDCIKELLSEDLYKTKPVEKI